MTLEEARIAMEAVMANNRKIHLYGTEPADHRKLDQWESHRAGLLEDDGLEQFRTAVAYLQLMKPTKTVSTKSPFSYGLKHGAERWGDQNGMSSYVGNGVLIAAALHLGMRVLLDDYNAHIGITLNSRQEVDEATGYAQPLPWRKKRRQ